ncbi:MAG: M23 family metallopeptidase [Amphiplicatus sp.]
MMRRLALFFALAALAGCATAPDRRASGAFMASLHLCPGDGISNAPPADSNRRVEGFEQTMVIRGVMLARAPVNACLSSGYGARSGGAGSFHHGVDLYTGAPRQVLAAGDGVIAGAGRQNGYGNVITIRHRNGVETRYAHLSSFGPGVRKGAGVAAGDVIGLTGNSGNATAVHLHYEVIVDGKTVNPLTIGR